MKKVLQFVWLQTLPVFFGYVFAGTAFGLLLQQAGYSPWWALAISVIVYAGAMQFVLITFLTGGVGYLSAFVMTLGINSRHMFYGLSFLEKFKAMGKKKWYMIFSLTDETYSLLCGTNIPEDLDAKTVYFLMAGMNQLYWIIGCVMGATIGQVITFDITGVDFAMTALFVVIFMEQWMSSKQHAAAYVGIGCAIVSILIFGWGQFILPALILSVVVLLGGKKLGKVQDIEGEVYEYGNE